MFQSDCLIVKQQSDLLKIHLCDLEYLEGNGRKTILHLGKQEVITSVRLSKLEQQLPPHLFLRCHQGFIVNLGKISHLQRAMAMTTSGFSVPISRTYREIVRAAFLNAAIKTEIEELIWEVKPY